MGATRPNLPVQTKKPIMNESDFSDKYSLMLIRMADASRSRYTLEETARLVGIHPERLRHYCRLGLLGETREEMGIELTFDDDALYELRRIKHFRERHGTSRKTLRLICGLWNQIEKLQAELRFLRSR